MSHCIPFPAHAAASTAVAVSWAGRVESAYRWLCQARHTAHPNHPVWHFRWNWNTWKTRLLTHLKSAHPSYRLSPVRRVLTAAGERLECWEPQDSLMLKLLAEHLQPVLLPALSNHCHHLKGRGGIKRAVHQVRQTVETGDYPFVARSDAKGYYANIQHTRLLELLRVHCREAWVLDLASQYCGRTLEQDGYYRTVTKGISLGCPLSPLMGALYLSPLDEAISHWSRWLRSLTDRSDPAAPAPQVRPPRQPTPRLSDDPSVPSHPSPPGRRGAINTNNRKDENKTDQDRSFRSQVATGSHGPRGHHRQLAGGHRADHPHGE